MLWSPLPTVLKSSSSTSSLLHPRSSSTTSLIHSSFSFARFVEPLVGRCKVVPQSPSRYSNWLRAVPHFTLLHLRPQHLPLFQSLSLLDHPSASVSARSVCCRCCRYSFSSVAAVLLQVNILSHHAPPLALFASSIFATTKAPYIKLGTPAGIHITLDPRCRTLPAFLARSFPTTSSSRTCLDATHLHQAPYPRQPRRSVWL